MVEMEGGGEPQATAVQQGHGKTPHQTEEPHRSRHQDSDSHTRQEGLDTVRKGIAKLKSVVKKSRSTNLNQLHPQPHDNPLPRRETGIREQRKSIWLHAMKRKLEA